MPEPGDIPIIVQPPADAETPLREARDAVLEKLDVLMRSQEDATAAIRKHSRESEDRERRDVARYRTMSNQIAKLDEGVKRAQESADIAHSLALEAKHTAGAVSISAEGSEHSLLAEVGSLKVVLNERKEGQEKLEAVLNQHAKDLEQSKKDRAAQVKLDARARKFWRLASPALIGVVLALLNRLTFILAPPSPTPGVEPPVKIVQVSATDGGAK